MKAVKRRLCVLLLLSALSASGTPFASSLRVRPADGGAGFDMQVGAVELVRAPVRDSLHHRALAMRADPAWMQQARYGVMVHWTKEPCRGMANRYGEKLAGWCFDDGATGYYGRNAPWESLALSPPTWNADQLAVLLQRFSACRNVPIFNLEITQEGLVSPLTLDLFEQVAAGPAHHEGRTPKE